jgi:serine/threonine-protein kinase
MQDRVIADRYRLIRQLGKGGMGSVWLAEHLSLKSEVAVKLIDSELGKLPQIRARFLREAQLAARIKSAHVVQVHDHGVTADDQPYIAMEYLVGLSLRERLDQRRRLPPAETARIVSHVCRALSRAHEAGLVHRDLKPENIFIARESDDELVKVLDFGVAKAADALADSGIDPTRTGALLGTPYYMSPEQAQGLKTVDYRTDLWAMGVVVFECLTGQRPFTAQALGPLIGKVLTGPIPVPSTTAPDAKISPDIDAWMTRAMARDPAARFASAKELAESFMIAAGASDSFGRDRSNRDVNAAAAAEVAAATRSTAGQISADTVVDSSSVGLEETLHMPVSGQTLPLGARVTGPPPVATSAPRLPDSPDEPIVVPRRSGVLVAVILGALAVAVLAGIVLLRR